MAVLVALPSTPLDGEPSPVVFRAGIETTMIAARAVTMGVDALQGYQLAAPMPAGGIPGLVRQLAISA